MGKLDLVIDSCFEDINLVGLCIRTLASKLFDKDQCDQIEICVVEVVTNCIKHSYKGMGGQKVYVSYQAYDDRLVIDIADSGIAINRELVEKESKNFDIDKSDIDNLPEGGMGLKIIKTWMDEVHYKTVDNLNHCILVKYINSQPVTSKRAV